MKKLLILFSIFSLFADEEISLWDFHPIHVGGNAIAFGPASVTSKYNSSEGNLKFDKANVYTYGLLPINTTNFFFPRIEYNAFYLNWDENPKFNQNFFQYMQFAVTFYSIALENWKWIARAEYNIDINHFSKPSEYSLWQALLWGSYEIHRKWHYHIGAYGYTGFEGDTVYPVIGFDFAPNKTWFFQLVFPFMYSIDYIFNKEWRLSLKGRPMKERFRTGPDEPQPRSIFSYSNFGLELNLKYEKFLRCELELFGGYNFGGEFYIKNRNGHDPIYMDVGGAPYIGASLNWGL